MRDMWDKIEERYKPVLSSWTTLDLGNRPFKNLKRKYFFQIKKNLDLEKNDQGIENA